MLQKEYHRKKDEYKTGVKNSILEKYGGEEHLDAPPKQLLLAQSENYVEYSRHGTVVKGAEKAVIKSIYEEDVYINNHTTAWGSYWRDGSWGFKCCYSILKESYCTGKAGQEAAKVAIEHLNLIPVTSGPASATTAAASSSDDEEKTDKQNNLPAHIQSAPVEGAPLPDVPLSHESGPDNVFRVGFLNQKDKDAGLAKCKDVMAAYN